MKNITALSVSDVILTAKVCKYCHCGIYELKNTVFRSQHTEYKGEFTVELVANLGNNFPKFILPIVEFDLMIHLSKYNINNSFTINKKLYIINDKTVLSDGADIYSCKCGRTSWRIPAFCSYINKPHTLHRKSNRHLIIVNSKIKDIRKNYI